MQNAIIDLFLIKATDIKGSNSKKSILFDTYNRESWQQKKPDGKLGFFILLWSTYFAQNL